jgi:aryl-alcohol dehydrogenase-like predicted oxidoreductase
MKQRLLKSLNVSVPQIALGTVELGLPYGLGVDGETTRPTFEQAERLVHAALDKGIRFIDTAPAYGDSEEILGRCLAGRRAELILTTKVGPLPLEGRSDADLATAIAASVEQSLRALRTDCVDWLMLHSASLSHVQQLERFRGPIETFRRQGKVRAFGASIYDDALRVSLEQSDLFCLQVAASAIDRRVESALAQSSTDGKDFVIRSVLLRGALTERYNALPASMQPLHNAIGNLDRLATEAGISLTELAYRYATEFNGLMLVGTASVPELEQAINFVEHGPLSGDVIAAIRAMDCLEDRFLNPAQWPKFEAETAGATA